MQKFLDNWKMRWEPLPPWNHLNPRLPLTIRVRCSRCKRYFDTIQWRRVCPDCCKALKGKRDAD